MSEEKRCSCYVCRTKALNKAFSNFNQACKASDSEDPAPRRAFPATGYERLHAVFRDAHDHAAFGKGDERHANGWPFHEQRMQRISHGLDSPDGMAFQAMKKIEEGLQMDDYSKTRHELLGALNYLAGIIIFLDDKNAGA